MHLHPRSHTHTNKRQSKIHTASLATSNYLKLPSHKVYQPEESRNKIKTENESLKKILRLTPESSRYLCGPGNRDKNKIEENRVVREVRASTPRASPKPDPVAHPAPHLRCAVGNRVSRPGPQPPRGYRLTPGSQRSLPHHLSKELTTKEPRRKSGGRDFQSLPSPSEKGNVSSFRPLLISAIFWR